MKRHLVAKLVGATVLLGALGGGVASAFTASNAVTASYAGEGVGSVSGYVVSNVHYTLAQSLTPVMGNDANVGGVTFTLNHAASQAGYALYDDMGSAIGGGTCVNTAGTWNWVCTANTNGFAPVKDVANLDVTAVN